MIVILSPHFDDSVLSCGGQIWAARQRGEAVRVLTLFAAPPAGEPPPFAQVQHAMWGSVPDANALRRAEDIAAHLRLGCADLRHLDAPDAVYRVSQGGSALYGTEAAIFGEIVVEESDYARQLAPIVRAHLPAGATLLAPLGVGRHVDHQLGFLVGQTLLEGGQRVAFYEEMPYIQWPAALERALSDKPGWQPQVLPLSEDAIAAKIAAMAYYRSQLPVLFGDDPTMERRLRDAARTAAGGAGYAERLWWPNG